EAAEPLFCVVAGLEKPERFLGHGPVTRHSLGRGGQRDGWGQKTQTPARPGTIPYKHQLSQRPKVTNVTPPRWTAMETARTEQYRKRAGELRAIAEKWSGDSDKQAAL